MRKSGYAVLPLHGGKAPRWLVNRMIKLAHEIVAIIISEFGREEFLSRISEPHWFQALGCVLGYDWHSSGVTTVLTGVLKNAINPEEFGIAVCGGKGKTSLKTPDEIAVIGEKFNFSTAKIRKLQYTSRITAKVDHAAIQAGYPLYHHAFFICEDGKWAVVQQGMNVNDRTARRYHWLGEKVESYVVEPHTAIVGDVKREKALDMTAKESEGCRKVSVDLAKEKPKKLMNLVKSVRPAYQKTLLEWVSETKPKSGYAVNFLYMPLNLNWDALSKAYEIQPQNYEELLGIKGVGPATVRGLALISELIYGDPPSWKDPIKYSFAYGGKDGVPYPVNRKAMDESIEILKKAIEESKIGEKDKIRSLRRLRKLISDHRQG